MQRAVSLSSFILRPVEASFYEDHNLIFKQKPYVVINVGDSEFTTSVDTSGGKHPHWSDKFSLQGEEGSMAYVKVYDREMISNDSLLGEAMFSITTSFFGENRQQTIDLFLNGKKTGEVKLEFSPYYAQDTPAGSQGLPTEGSLNTTTTTELEKSFTTNVKDQISHLGEKLGSIVHVGQSANSEGVRGIFSAVKDQVDHLGVDLSTVGHKISETVNDFVHPQHHDQQQKPQEPQHPPQDQSYNPETGHLREFAYSNANSSVEFPSSKLPESTNLQPLKPVQVGGKLANVGVQDFHPVNLASQGDVNHNIPIALAGTEGNETLEHWKAQAPLDTEDVLAPKPGVLDKSNTEYFDDPNEGKTIRTEMDATGLNKLEKDFKLSEPNSGLRDDWSTVSNAGSVLEREEATPVEQPLLAIEAKPTLLAQGKQKLNEVTEQGKQIAANVSEKAQASAQYLAEHGQQLAHDASVKASALLEEGKHVALDAQDRALATSHTIEAKAENLYEQGKQLAHNASEKTQAGAQYLVEHGQQFVHEAGVKAGVLYEQGKHVAHDAQDKALATSHNIEAKAENLYEQGKQLAHDAQDRALATSHTIEAKAEQLYDQGKQLAHDASEKTQAGAQYLVEHGQQFVHDAGVKAGVLYEQGKQVAHDAQDKALSASHTVEAKAEQLYEQGKELAHITGQKVVETTHNVEEKAAQLYEQGKQTAHDVQDLALAASHTVEARAGQLYEQGKELAHITGQKVVETTHNVEEKAAQLYEQGKETASNLQDKALHTAETVEMSAQLLYGVGKEVAHNTSEKVQAGAHYLVEHGQQLVHDAGVKAGVLYEQGKQVAHDAQDKALSASHTIEAKAEHLYEEGKLNAHDAQDLALAASHTVEAKAGQLYEQGKELAHITGQKVLETSHNVEEKAAQLYEQGKETASNLQDRALAASHTVEAKAEQLYDQGKHTAENLQNKALATSHVIEQKAEHLYEQGKTLAHNAGEATVDALETIENTIVHLASQGASLVQSALHKVEAGAVAAYHNIEHGAEIVAERGNVLASTIGERASHVYHNVTSALHRAETSANTTATTEIAYSEVPSNFSWVDHSDKIVVGRHLDDEGYEGSPVDHTRHHTTHDVREKIDDLGQKVRDYVAGNQETGQTGLVQQGKELISKVSEKVQDSFSGSVEHPSSLPLDSINSSAIIERPAEEDGRPAGDVGEPPLAEVSKELVPGFSQRADQVSLDRKGSQVEKLGEPEGPNDIDVVDIGPQDFNIDTKFNDASTFDKGGEVSKEAIFDSGFNSNEKLIRKAEEMTSHEGIENPFGQQGLISQANQGISDKSGESIDKNLNFGRTDSGVTDNKPQKAYNENEESGALLQ